MAHVAVFLLLFCSLSAARAINVTTTAELQAAINAALPGDSLLLIGGQYIPVATNRDGTLQAPIVVKGAGPGAVIVKTSGDGMNLYGAHWIFEDLRFDGSGGSLILHPKPGAGDYITVRNCFLYNCSYKGIKIDGYADYFLLENSTMAVGIAGLMNNDGADFLTCRGNYTFGFTDPGGGAVQYIIFSKWGLAYSVFENNLIVGGKRGLISFGGGSVSTPPFRHDNDLASAYPPGTVEVMRSIARNNIVIRGEGGFSTSTTLDCEFYNNTIIDCQAALWVEPHHGNPFNVQFYNNLVLRTPTLVQNDGAFVVKSNNKSLNVDPASVFTSYNPNNASLSDFRIKPAMAATVGQGRTPVEHPSWPITVTPPGGYVDYYGNPRAVPPMIGATEMFQGIAVEGRSVSNPQSGVTLSVSPNPAREGVELTLDLKRDRRLVDVLVFDARGRHVRTVYYGPMTEGETALRWDGRSHGRIPAPPGTYFFRVSLGKDVMYEKFQRVR